MKRFTVLLISAIMLIVTSCGPSVADLEALSQANELNPTNYQSFDEALNRNGGYNSDIDYVKVKNHDWLISYIYGNRISTVFIHPIANYVKNSISKNWIRYTSKLNT